MIHGLEIILDVRENKKHYWAVLYKGNTVFSGYGIDQEDAWQKACRAKKYIQNNSKELTNEIQSNSSN